jgi:hypothetical protein
MVEGIQVLYLVVEHANEIVRALFRSPKLSDNPVFKPAVKTPKAIH